MAFFFPFATIPSVIQNPFQKNLRNEPCCLFLSGTFHVFKSSFSTMLQKKTQHWARSLAGSREPKLDLRLVREPESRFVSQKPGFERGMFANLSFGDLIMALDAALWGETSAQQARVLHKG